MTILRLPYPISSNRYWRRAGAMTYVSTEAKAYKKQAALLALNAGIRPLVGTVAVDVVFHPKTTKKGAANRQRLDLDNVLKVTLDALQGVAFENDSQVHSIRADVGQPVEDGGLSVLVCSMGVACAQELRAKENPESQPR